jgi:hypothetical protein
MRDVGFYLKVWLICITSNARKDSIRMNNKKAGPFYSSSSIVCVPYPVIDKEPYCEGNSGACPAEQQRFDTAPKEVRVATKKEE